MVAPLIFPGWLGTAEGRAGNWAPVGLVILAGLTTSTFLTFFFCFSTWFKRCARVAPLPFSERKTCRWFWSFDLALPLFLRHDVPLLSDGLTLFFA